jgi:hypothetical protein
MSKVKIQGNASGTGVVTLTAPNTNTDRTITLPDDTQTLIGTNASGNVGIGTSSPSTKLHILTNTNTQHRIETTTTGAVPVTQYKNAAGDIHQIGSETSSGNAAFSGASAYSLCLYAASGRDINFGQQGNHRMRIDSAGIVTMPNQPSFDAYTVSSSATFTNQVIEFNNISTHNTGGHYSTSTYRFTAPVAGKYLFTYNVQKSGTANTETQFQKNGAKLSDTHVHHTANGNHGSQSVVWYLSANDYVNVKILGGTISGDYSHFSGHLLG